MLQRIEARAVWDNHTATSTWQHPKKTHVKQEELTYFISTTSYGLDDDKKKFGLFREDGGTLIISHTEGADHIVYGILYILSVKSFFTLLPRPSLSSHGTSPVPHQGRVH
jgi:hypothetical protein